MSRSKAMLDFNGFLDKATNPEQIDLNKIAVLQLCDIIEEIKVTPEEAVQAIHGKIMDENPRRVLFAVKVLDIVFNKCGNLVQKVICSADYMNLLKDVIQYTEHRSVKEKIIELLEKWADLYQYFPQYSELQALLNLLKSDSYALVSDDIDQISNGNLSLKQLKISTEQSSISSTGGFTEVHTFDSNMLDITPETTLNNDKSGMESQLLEYRIKKKQVHKQYLKSKGLPTSSDEEDCSKDEMSSSDFINEFEEISVNSIDNQHLIKSHQLPKDLENIKKQRYHLTKQAKEIRTLKHQEFLENNGHNDTDIKKCQNSECQICKVKQKNKSEETSVVPKQWPYEVRKIKESKKKLKEAFELYKLSQKQCYYGKKTDTK